MGNASFSFNDTVVVVLGQTFYQCGDAIDVTVMEKNTKAWILYSTRDQLRPTAEIRLHDAGNKPASAAEATDDR